MSEGQSRVRAYDVPNGGTAQRPSWEELPDAVRAAIEAQIGQAVVAATSQGGGFTDGFASRLKLADGSGLFVKAISSLTNAQGLAGYEQELRISQRLPDEVPAPALRWSCHIDDWVVLAFEDVEGHTPARPWRQAELDPVLQMVTVLAEALTPAPRGMPALETTRDIDEDFSFWRTLVQREGSVGSIGNVSLPPMSRDVRRLMAELEGEWADAAAGESAVHFDLRDDNLILSTDGRVLACDWNWLTLAAPWVDLVGLLVSIHGDGLDADAIVATHVLTRDVPDRSIDALLAALAGYYIEAASRAPFSHSPWLRIHQAWWRDATLSWLSRRLRTAFD
jgi:aminoglycoside phosphotransferase (APT) family kinase protein